MFYRAKRTFSRYLSRCRCLEYILCLFVSSSSMVTWKLCRFPTNSYFNKFPARRTVFPLEQCWNFSFIRNSNGLFPSNPTGEEEIYMLHNIFDWVITGNVSFEIVSFKTKIDTFVMEPTKLCCSYYGIRVRVNCVSINIRLISNVCVWLRYRQTIRKRFVWFLWKLVENFVMHVSYTPWARV